MSRVPCQDLVGHPAGAAPALRLLLPAEVLALQRLRAALHHAQVRGVRGAEDVRRGSQGQALHHLLIHPLHGLRGQQDCGHPG